MAGTVCTYEFSAMFKYTVGQVREIELSIKFEQFFILDHTKGPR